ncbi:MAG: FtsQ-type POTRA domain-containing protein [Actinomycetota bacterium]|nr:FtsQ-type POTRA domain-containing protein [Actinomycetota bacterium]
MTDSGPRTGIRSRSAGMVLMALGLLLGGWLLINSRFFAVQRVMVRGAAEVSSIEVVELAAVPEEANLIRLGVDAVATRVERHPWVAHAEVTRDLPSTLVIRIRERSPAGWLEDGDRILLVAGDGAVLERVERAPGDVPALGEGGAGLAPGGTLSRVPPVLDVAATMPPTLLRQADAVAEESQGLVVSLRAGGEAWYGEAGELDGKHRAVASILAWAEEQEVAVGVIDVRVPSAPTLRPAGGGTRIALPSEPDLVPSAG